MSVAFWGSSTWFVGESDGGGSWGNGVNVLDGGGLFSAFVACCLFLSYLSRLIRTEFRKGFERNTNESLGASSLRLPVVSFRHWRWWGTEVNWLSR